MKITDLIIYSIAAGAFACQAIYAGSFLYFIIFPINC